MNKQEEISQHFDVIISGGGLSGSLMALSLSQLKQADGTPLTIAIVEAQTINQTNTSNHLVTSQSIDEKNLFDARVLALSHGSANYLNKIGAWQFLSAQACAITDIDISDRGHFAKTRLSAEHYNVNALGYVIDMALIGKAQLKALSENTLHTNNVHWFTPDSITSVNWQAHREYEKNADTLSGIEVSTSNEAVQVTLNSGKKLTAALLLGCDGMQSPVRKLANIAVKRDDYKQVALITNVATSKAHNNKAYERFTEFGPIAMLPLSSINTGESRCSLVWTMTPEQAAEISCFSDREFKVALEEEFGSYLGSITQVGKRDVYPLALLQAKQQVFHRMALVGNASHTIHPIAGQGFNLGLRDVQTLVELVGSALSENKDIGSFNVLHEYQKNRAQDQQQVINLTDSLVTLFANRYPPLVVGRNIGLQALNCISSVKDRLVKKTMGY